MIEILKIPQRIRIQKSRRSRRTLLKIECMPFKSRRTKIYLKIIPLKNTKIVVNVEKTTYIIWLALKRQCRG